MNMNNTNTTPLSQDERLELIKAFTKKGKRNKKQREHNGAKSLREGRFSEDYLSVFKEQFEPNDEIIDYHVGKFTKNNIDSRLILAEN